MKKPFPDDSFLARWMDGTLSEAERKELEQRDDYEQLKKIVLKSKQLNVPDFSEEQAWQNLLEAKAKQQVPRPRRWSLYAMASAATIALLVGAWFLLRSPTVFVASAVSTKEVVLPDESVVTLNENSSIQYQSGDWKHERAIALKGEAFFEVKKGASFIVNTEAGQVKVLGTSFNVNSRDTSFDVACYTGKVQVNYKKDNIVLLPGEGVEATKADTLKKVHNNTQKAPAWLAGIITFKSAPLETVVQELERQFDIQIQLEEGHNRLYSGGFTTDDLNTALKSVFDPMALSYEVNSDSTIVIVR